MESHSNIPVMSTVVALVPKTPSEKITYITSQHQQGSCDLAGHNYIKRKELNNSSQALLVKHDVRFLEHLSFYNAEGEKVNLSKCLLYPFRTYTNPAPIQYQAILDKPWLDGPEKITLISGITTPVFSCFGNPDLDAADQIIIAESLTKAAALFEALSFYGKEKISVLNALNAGNMGKLISYLSAKGLSEKLCVACDNDKAKYREAKRAGKKSNISATGIILRVEQALQATGVPYFMPPDDLPAEANDFDDWYNSSPSAASDIDQALLDRQSVLPTIIPFDDLLFPVPPMLPDMLPKNLIAFVCNLSHRMNNQSLDFAAVTVIIVIASLIGGRMVMQPKAKDSGWKVPLTLWGCLIGPPSAKKSPIAKEIIKLLHQIKREHFDPIYEQELVEYRAKKDLYELTAKSARREAEKKINTPDLSDAQNLNDAQEILRSIHDQQLTPPQERQLVVNDATMEKMVEILSHHPMGTLLFRDELSGWLARMEQHDCAQERSFYLECFEGLGNTYTQARISADERKAENTLLSLMGTIQPDKLKQLLVNRAKGKGNDGLFERIQLAIYPDFGGKYTDIAPDKEAEQHIYAFLYSLSQLESTQEPQIYRFDDEAQREFTTWACAWHDKVQQSPPDLQAVFGKWEALVAKLSLLFHLASGESDTVPSAVSLKAFQQALTWIDYLEAHQRRIRTIGQDPYQAANALLAKIPSLLRNLNRDNFTKSDIRNKAWSGLNMSADRDQALNHLVEHHYLLASKEPTGTKTTTVYRVNPDYTG